MVKPRDEAARARFATELDRNFSVVASAGSGKTTAITQRILSIARSPNAFEILPRLVVVTFTNRAADEMQQRTRQALIEEHLRQEVQTAFNRAFFGTIHSFCMKLLTDFGHYLGLPAIGNICAGRFVSRRQTPNSLSSGRRNLRLCENGSAKPPPASRRRCNVIIAIFDSTTDSSPTEIKSRSRKSCCNIRSPRRGSAKKAFVSFSTKRRTLSRCNFRCCWKRRARRKRKAFGCKIDIWVRGPAISAWSAISSNRFTGSGRT